MGKQKIAGKFQEAFKNTLFRENVKLILCAGEKKKKSHHTYSDTLEKLQKNFCST